MLQIFKSNQILAAVLFLLYLAVFYGATQLNIDYPKPVGTAGVLGQLIYDALPDLPHDIWLRVSALLLVFFQAILLVLMVNENRINNDSNLLAGVFYCLFASMVPQFMYPSPALLANTFLLIALMELMGVYKIPVASGRLFNVGFWISVASLFYFSSLGMIAFALWGTSTLRAYNLRDLITIFFGAITPYFLVGTAFFLLDRFPEFMDLQFARNLAFWDFQQVTNSISYIEAGMFGLLILIVLLGSSGFFQKKIMQVQKKISLLYGFLLFSCLISIFQASGDISHLLLACIPLAVFFSMSFSVMATQWAEVVHLLMLVAGLALAYSPWLLRGL